MDLKSRLLPLFYRVPSLSRWTALYGKPAHDGDGMAIWGRSVPFADPAFANAYIATTQFTTDRLRRMDIRWRAYVCCWAAKQALAVEGDFVECGVNTGILSGTICRYLAFGQLERQFWLLDTYEGIPDELAKETERGTVKSHNRHYSDVWEIANMNFAAFKNTTLVRGKVPGTLSEVKTDAVSYLSVDMNIAAPERSALEYFWPKMAPGGVIVLDDYGFAGHDEQRLSADEFAASVGHAVLALPTGQGLIIKTGRGI